MPPIFNIYQVVAENLRYHGFEVVEFIYEEQKFVYTSLWQRLKKLFYRNVNTKKNNSSSPICPSSNKNLTASKGKPTTAS